MPFYENVFIARQDLTPAKVKELAGKFAAVVKENGGAVAKTEDWGLRDLAYKIQNCCYHRAKTNLLFQAQRYIFAVLYWF